MLLTNNSDLTWAFKDANPETVIRPYAGDDTTLDFQAEATEAFHTWVRSNAIYSYGFMLPTEKVVVDGGSSTVEWIIQPWLSTTWNTNGFLFKQLLKAGTETARTALTQNSPTGRAVWDCSKAVYDVSKDSPKLISSPDYDPIEQISTGLGIASTSGRCATSWLNAEREAGNVKILPWKQVADEAYKELKPAAELAEKSSTLKEAVAVAWPAICKILPRC